MNISKSGTYIIGGGMTGLAAGMASGGLVFEAKDIPGGICSSYYLSSEMKEPAYKQPEERNAYRFEIGGGHWIFGGDPTVLRFIENTVSVKSYKRKSGVFFSKLGLYVPYPVQNHLAYLGRDIAAKCLSEIVNTPKIKSKTMAEWLEINFGKTLFELFFAPFHELYTAGLWTEISPQDSYKSPVDLSLVIRGALDKDQSEVGYNVTYIYPQNGLDSLSQKMAKQCNIHYGKEVFRVNPKRKEIEFSDGTILKYKYLISTLPLNKMVEISGIEVDESMPPYTSVLVLNIGAKKGKKCPDDHWLYIPDSESRFHRVGFYSNVDESFLPRSYHEENDLVSIYVEKAYRNGGKPSKEDISLYIDCVIKELKSWGFIEEVEVAHPTWIDVAYTWTMPGSRWKEKALTYLQDQGIYQVGRYGRWKFQGIADSIKDGFFAGSAFREYKW